ERSRDSYGRLCGSTVRARPAHRTSGNETVDGPGNVSKRLPRVPRYSRYAMATWGTEGATRIGIPSGTEGTTKLEEELGYRFPSKLTFHARFEGKPGTE